MTELKYSRDGIPIYGGEPELFEAYKEAAREYVETTEFHKRYLTGPRLAAQVQGRAKTAIRAKTAANPSWLTRSEGAELLLQCLEEKLSQEPLEEVQKCFSNFFQSTRRRRGEGMGAFINRHEESFWRCNRALRKAQKEHGGKLGMPGLPELIQTPAASSYELDSGSAMGEPNAEVEGAEEPAEAELGLSETGLHGSQRAPTDGNSWTTSQNWWETGYGYGYGYSDYGNSGWSKQSWSQPPTAWSQSADADLEKKAKPFLPDFLLAWMLLQKAGLTTAERNNVMTIAGAVFNYDAIAKALKKAWPDEELTKRDRQHGGHGMMADDNDAYMVGDDENDEAMLTEDLTAEDSAAYLTAEMEAQSALAAIRQGRNTLREARGKQHTVRMNRKFYDKKPTAMAGAKPKCLKCGGAHETKDCRKSNNSQEARIAEDEDAGVVFMATVWEPAGDLWEHFSDTWHDMANIPNQVLQWIWPTSSIYQASAEWLGEDPALRAMRYGMDTSPAEWQAGRSGVAMAQHGTLIDDGFSGMIPMGISPGVTAEEAVRIYLAQYGHTLNAEQYEAAQEALREAQDVEATMQENLHMPDLMQNIQQTLHRHDTSQAYLSHNAVSEITREEDIVPLSNLGIFRRPSEASSIGSGQPNPWIGLESDSDGPPPLRPVDTDGPPLLPVDTDSDGPPSLVPAHSDADDDEIIFMSDEQALTAEQLQSLVKGGKCIIDGGATATLGSLDAIEVLQKTLGNDHVTVDGERRPTFKFGNGGRERCISTVGVKMNLGSKKGQLNIHAHEIPNQPILFSIKSLRALGAVIDFEEDEVLFKKIDPLRVVKLERAANGHQVMKLTGDLLEGSRCRSTPFKGLIE